MNAISSPAAELPLPQTSTVCCNLWLVVCVLQQARELVLEIVREKDQGDFRPGRLGDFGSRLGGVSTEVSVQAHKRIYCKTVCWIPHDLWSCHAVGLCLTQKIVMP